MIWMRRKAEAAKAWEKLRAFDTTAANRSQLVAAGVASRRISLLYPEVGFAASEANLIEHLASVPVDQLSAASGINQLRVDFTNLLPLGYDFPTGAESPWMGAREATEGILGQYLSARIETEALSGFLTYNNAIAHASNLAAGIYWAWWGMHHRPSFPQASRRDVDWLMLGVAKIIQLDGKPAMKRGRSDDKSA